MAVISFLNQKGGVGKTSTTFHLAGALAETGRRILLVDNDPQSSLTQGIWGRAHTLEIPAECTVAAIYAGSDPFPEHVIRPTGISGVDLVPGSRAAANHNLPVPSSAPLDSQLCLRGFLESVEGYDLVLIDCQPTLMLCSWSALACSDGVVIPVQPEDYGAQGIPDVLESIDHARSMVNPGLRTLGIVLTLVAPRRAIHQLFENTLRSSYGDLVFDARVPASPEFPEAILQRKTITQYKPKGANARGMRTLAAELMTRVNGQTHKEVA